MTETTTTTIPALLSCPFCGASDPLVTDLPPHKHAIAALPDHPGSVTVECPACAIGLIKPTRAEAVASWNKRAAPSPAPAAPSAAQTDAALTVLQKLVGELDGLMDDSEGVAGLHKNGDIAPWDDLMSDGRYPWLGSLDEARAVCVRAAAPSQPAQGGSVTSALEFRPDLGAATLEPSLREIVHGYYAAHFRDGGSAKFADEYLDAISAARASAPEAPEAPEVVDARTKKLLQRVGMLSGVARHIKGGKPMTKDIADMLAADANHILSELAALGISHCGISDTEAAALRSAGEAANG